MPEPPDPNVAPLVLSLSPAVTAGIIAAVVALVIAIVTNVWQGRRERDRDKTHWDREDRHRFVELKRELYTDLIVTFEKYRQSALMLLAELTQGADESGRAINAATEEFDALDELRDRADSARVQIQLVAPEGIVDEVNAALRKLLETHSALQNAVNGRLGSEIAALTQRLGEQSSSENAHDVNLQEVYVGAARSLTQHKWEELVVAMRGDILKARNS